LAFPKHDKNREVSRLAPSTKEEIGKYYSVFFNHPQQKNAANDVESN